MHMWFGISINVNCILLLMDWLHSPMFALSIGKELGTVP